MGTPQARDLVRQAQQAELTGDTAAAVALLKRAAELHLSSGEGPRAAALLRHCLRLIPGDEAIAAVLRAAEEIEPAPVAQSAPLELPQRGPTLADPAIDCWCSFCCRPKTEVGPMAGGPAGAFVCASCIEAAGRILRASPTPATKPQAISANEEVDFVDAAVELGARLGWTLAEVRGLTPQQRKRALERLGPMRPTRRPPRKKRS